MKRKFPGYSVAVDDLMNSQEEIAASLDELAFFKSPGSLTIISAPELGPDSGLDRIGVMRLARGLAIHEQNVALYGVTRPADQHGLEHLHPAEVLLDPRGRDTCQSPAGVSLEANKAGSAHVL